MKITVDTTDKAQVQAAEGYFMALDRINHFRGKLANIGADALPEDIDYYAERLMYWKGEEAATFPVLGVTE